MLLNILHFYIKIINGELRTRLQIITSFTSTTIDVHTLFFEQKNNCCSQYILLISIK